MLRRLLPSLLSDASTKPPFHRPMGRADAERLRWTVNGKFVPSRLNPGIRVEPDFVTEAEAAALVSELEEAASTFGYPYDGDARAHLLAHDGSGEVETTIDNVVNNVRVTGRVERPDVQKLPKWGYGDGFDKSALPPTMAMLAERIATCGNFRVGKPRDVTINSREHSFFQLDPHVDPESDGPDVFILGLESSVVLTFTPPEEALPAELRPRRKDPQEVGMKSWTDRDIDAIVLPRTLVHFTGDARSSWMHAIRSGVHVGGSGGGSGAKVCDWWGQPDYLLQRGHRRLSLVLAFGEADQDE